MTTLFLVAGFCLITTSLATSYKRVCYVTMWSKDRNGLGQFSTSDVDSNLCTHLIVAYADIQSHELVVASSDLAFLTDLINLKTSNPDLKVLLAVGGEDFANSKFTGVVSTTAIQEAFIQSCVVLLRGKNLDGINLDWRFPGSGNKEKFTSLCQGFHDSFENEATTTGQDKLLFTAAVSGNKDEIDASYEITDIETNLDFINVLSYDFYDPNGGFAKHHSPLHKMSSESGVAARANAEFAMMYWKNKGASGEKLLMGIASYGRTFRLRSIFYHTTGAQTLGPGVAGAFTQEEGLRSYYEICRELPDGNRRWSDEQKVPSGAIGVLWMGFDNEASIEAKVDFVQQYGFGGASIWSMDLDDFSGSSCGQGTYPLVSHMYDSLITVYPINTTTAEETGTVCPPEDPEHFCIGREDISYPVTGFPSCYYKCTADTTDLTECPTDETFVDSCKCCQDSTGASSTLTTTAAPTGPDMNFCQDKSNGLIAAIPSDAHSYYHCVHGITYIQPCPSILIFNPACTCCDWP